MRSISVNGGHDVTHVNTHVVHMSVHMSVRMPVHMSVHMSVHTHVCESDSERCCPAPRRYLASLYEFLLTCLCICPHACLCTCLCTCLSASSYKCPFAYTSVCACVRTTTHVCTKHTGPKHCLLPLLLCPRTHTHTHTHTFASRPHTDVARVLLRCGPSYVPTRCGPTQTRAGFARVRARSRRDVERVLARCGRTRTWPDVAQARCARARSRPDVERVLDRRERRELPQSRPDVVRAPVGCGPMWSDVVRWDSEGRLGPGRRIPHAVACVPLVCACHVVEWMVRVVPRTAGPPAIRHTHIFF